MPGLYIGTYLFASAGELPETIEPATVLVHDDGTWEQITRLETYALVTTPVIPPIEPFNDQESTGFGVWSVNCDGTITFAGVEYRQAGPAGGIPALVGLTNTEIPSLPNYMIVSTSKYVLDGDFLTLVPETLQAYFTDVNWNPDNKTCLYPFLQILEGNFQRLTPKEITNIINEFRPDCQ